MILLVKLNVKKEKNLYILKILNGWDHGSGHLVTINGVDYGGYDFTTGISFSYTICLDPTDCLDFSFTDGGPWEDECSYNLVNSGVTIFSGDHQKLIKLLEIAPLLAVQILRLVILTLKLKMMMVVVFTHL